MPEFVRVVRDVTLAGEIVLDPRYDPPWPGAGIKSAEIVPDAAAEDSGDALDSG